MDEDDDVFADSKTHSNQQGVAERDGEDRMAKEEDMEKVEEMEKAWQRRRSLRLLRRSLVEEEGTEGDG